MSALRRGGAGFSIIELLIAITLGLLLTLGLINVFINSKQAYRLQEATARMQENGRFAVDTLARAIRLADFWGSAAPDQVTLAGPAKYGAAGDGCDDEWLINPSEGIRGYEGGPTAPGGLPTDCIEASDYVGSSDAIAVRYADPDNAVPDADLGTDHDTGSYFLRVLTGRSGLLFNGNESSEVGNAKTRLPDVAGSKGAVINYRFRPELYFLKQLDGSPTLHYKRATDKEVESTALVDGIEMMNFEYGVDTDGDFATDGYVRAADLTTTAAWSKVLSVRVSLIVRGDEVDNFVDGKTYDMAGGDTYAAKAKDQRFLRTQIVKEVQVRNRVRMRG